MTQISTISEFLLQAGTEYRVYDMGRGIRNIPEQHFLDMENALFAPACPRQQHAWFGLLFWNKHMSEQRYIWFIKLPLDETGLIQPASRNHFLQIIVDALGVQLEKAKGQGLPENPYTFVPNQHQLADFNSISRAELELAPSNHFEAASHYLQAPTLHDWQQVPLQGIADIAARVTDKNISQLIEQGFNAFAPQVRNALLVSLENQAIPTSLSLLLIDHARQLIASSDCTQLIPTLRALSQSQETNNVSDLLLTLLASKSINADGLTVVAGRLWSYLQNPIVLSAYMEKLAEIDKDVPLFVGMFSDLVQVPELRPQLLAWLRSPKRSATLSACIGKLFSETNE